MLNILSGGISRHGVYVILCLSSAFVTLDAVAAPMVVPPTSIGQTQKQISQPIRSTPKPMVRTEKEQIAQEVLDGLAAGKPQLLAVTLDDSAIETDAHSNRQLRHLMKDDADIIQVKRTRYKQLKDEVLSGYSSSDLQVVKSYRSTAQIIVRISSMKVLKLLVNDPRVSHINSPEEYGALINGVAPQSALGGNVQMVDKRWQELVGQPAVINAGYKGSGAVIAIIDTADSVLGQGPFSTDGNVMPTASSPAVTANCAYYFPYCHVAADAYCYADSLGFQTCSGCDYVKESGSTQEHMDCDGVTTQIDCTVGGVDGYPFCYIEHQIEVAIMAASTAPEAKIDAVTLSSSSMNEAGLTEALNWVLDVATDVTVINLSVGSLSQYSSSCTSIQENLVLQQLHDRGVVIVAASGNNGAGFTQPAGISAPACNPNVISVGAVTADQINSSSGTDDVVFQLGNGGTCSVYTGFEPVDTMPCFSNYAGFLTIAAPGVGYSDDVDFSQFGYGTSYAAPVVTGAVAILQRVRNDGPAAITTRLRNTASNSSILFADHSTGTVKRLDMLGAVNDALIANQNNPIGGGSGGNNGQPSTGQIIVIILQRLLIP